MKTTHDWLQKNHEALYDQGTQSRTYINNPMNRERMGFSPMTPQGQWLDMSFEPKFQAFAAAFDDWKNPAERTPVKTARLEAAETVFREVYRLLYTGFLKSSPLVTDEDLVSMGLPTRHSGGGGHVPPPTTYVEGVVTPVGPGVLDIHFRDKGSDHKAKPAGVHGAEMIWAILDTPPTNWEQLVHSSFDTHTPLRLSFENDQRGQTIYFAMRWENSTGAKGPWSEIQSAIIP
jgi:hypothetical protein